MIAGGERQFVGMPFIDNSGQVFPPTIIQGEITQTLPFTQEATALVTHPLIDEGTLLRLYGWTPDGAPRIGVGRNPTEAKENLILDLIDGLDS